MGPSRNTPLFWDSILNIFQKEENKLESERQNDPSNIQEFPEKHHHIFMAAIKSLAA